MVRTATMTDPAEARAARHIGDDPTPMHAPPPALAHACHTRLLERDGEVVGCAWIDVPSDEFARELPFRAMWRSVDGLTATAVEHKRLRPDTVVGWVDGWWARNARKRVRRPASDFARLAARLFDVTEGIQPRTSLRMSASLLTWLTGGRRPVTAHDDLLVGEAMRSRRTVFAAYLATLDPDVLRRAVGAADQDVLVGGSWDGHDPAFAVDVPLRRALARRPLLPTALSNAWCRDRAAFRMAMADDDPDVDALGALALRELSGMRSEVLPHVLHADAELRALPAEILGRLVARQASRTVDAACDVAEAYASLPPSWRPRDPVAWRAFADLQPALDVVRRSWCFPRVGSEHLPLVLPCRGDWCALAVRLAAAAGVTADGIPAALDDVQDLLSAFEHQVVAPGARLSEEWTPSRGCASYAGGLARDLLFMGRSLPRAIELSRAWHAAQARIDAGIAALPGAPPSAWGAGLPDAAFGDLHVAVLTDVGSLAAEVASGPDADGVVGLSHCVGGYGNRCRSGTVRVVSVRRTGPDGQIVRLSTAAFDVDGGQIRLTEHRGARNGPPPPEAATAMNRYVAGITSRGLPVDRTVLRSLPCATGETMGAGYDWRVEGAWEAVLDLWRPILPRPLRAMTVRGLGAVVGDRPPIGGARGWRPEPYRF